MGLHGVKTTVYISIDRITPLARKRLKDDIGARRTWEKAIEDLK